LTNPHALQAALYAVVFAPSGLLKIAEQDTAQHGGPLGYWNDHVSFYVTGGLASGHDGPILGASWTGSGNLEVLWRSTFAEARMEQFRLLDHVEYRTVRVGRLFHPDARMAGGVTLGYRSVRNLRAHEGVEIGFPFIYGGRNTWTRFEAAYVLSEKQSSWNYRLQWERRVGRGPFIVGCNVELKSWEIRNHGQLSHGMFAIVLGTTAGRQ
jgi:hypothetical protein